MTPWTQVTQARGDDTRARASMEILCKLYWVPLYSFSRRQGMSPEESEDVTQGFFVQLVRIEIWVHLFWLVDRGLVQFVFGVHRLVVVCHLVSSSKPRAGGDHTGVMPRRVPPQTVTYVT